MPMSESKVRKAEVIFSVNVGVCENTKFKSKGFMHTS